MLKGCVRYIFASLFLCAKDSFFPSWDNQILNFKIFKCHGITKCPSMKHETYFTEFIAPNPTPHWVMGGGGWLGAPGSFFRTFYGRDLGQIGIPCTENSEYKSHAKNDSYCNFYNLSPLVPYLNKFVVVSICTVIFHGMYSHYPQILFLWEANFFFFRSCS